MDLNRAKEEIRNRIDIVDYIGSFVKLERRSSNYFGLCPFHSEKTPSFCVNPNNQTWYCFGQCKKGGDIFKFVEEYNNCNFFEAVKFLADKLNINIDSGYNSTDNEEKKQLYELYRNVANEYYKALFSEKGKEGIEYIKKRKINKETVKKFGLGFAPNEYGYIYNILKNNNFPENILKASELFTYKEDGNAFDKFYNRVMFPIQDVNGKVIAFGGRRIDDIKENKYINSKTTMIFKKSEVLYGMHIAKMSKRDYFILCEGNIDVITLHQAGYDNAVAMLGVGINDSLIKQMSRYKKKIMICPDNDKTGIDTTIKAINLINKWGVDVKILNITANVDDKDIKDVDEFINNKSLGAVEFEKRLNNAMDSFLFIVHHIKDKYKLSDPQDYAKYIEEVINKLLEIKEKIVRDKYIELVSKAEHIDENDLKTSIDSKVKTNINFNSVEVKNNIQNSDNKEDTKLSQTIKDFISILLMHNELVPLVHNYVNENDIYDVDMREIYMSLINGTNIDDDKSKKMMRFLIEVDNNIDYNKAVFHMKALIKRIKERIIKDKLDSLKTSNDINDLNLINDLAAELKKIKNEEIVLSV